MTIHLAVAFDGTGWHPASWREAAARPAELLTAGYWVGLVQEAERGLLDLVTFEDALSLQPDGQVQGRLDAVLVASRVAPRTSHIGLVPTVVVTHTEPFHVSKAIATLDYLSTGRAGVRVRTSRSSDEAAHFGRKGVEPIEERFAEAADHVEVIRRLWDSWEDDAEIRDAASGRFVDREKLHYIDFTGRHFSVRGPSITPRPPQGQPLVAALAHVDIAYRLVASSADLGFVTPHSTADIPGILAAIGAGPRVLGDLVVFLDVDEGAAADRKARLDTLAPFPSDALTFTGTPAQLADLVQEWHVAGLAGVRLRPAVLDHDLPLITRGLVPELQRRGAFRTSYEATTLRGHFGLPRPANRYAGV